MVDVIAAVIGVPMFIIICSIPMLIKEKRKHDKLYKKI